MRIKLKLDVSEEDLGSFRNAAYLAGKKSVQEYFALIIFEHAALLLAKPIMAEGEK